jgi:hypothetical protein
MVALFRMTTQNLFAGRTKLLAGWLLAVTLVAMMAPGGLYLFPQPWNTVYLSAQVAVWIIVLLFIAYHARQLRIPG